jgi:SSU ribosomal protein S30P/sigma 54 modulation protein
MIKAMKVQITAKKMQLSPSFTDYAEERLSSKLDKFFGSEANAKIVLNTVKNNVILELTVEMGGMIFRAEQSAADKNDALDACIDKIIRQIRKNKTRLAKQLRDKSFTDSIEPAPDEQVDYEVIKHKSFELRPMSVEEAILQMNLVDHEFFMFKNAETGDVNVVYKRSDDNYAVLEPRK